MRALLCLLTTALLLLPSYPVFAAQNKVTVLVYMCGSDLESEYGSATDDLKEMIKGIKDDSGVRVLVETGGTTSWKALGIKGGALQRHELTSNGLETISTLKKASMGEASTLSDFIRWGLQTAPAERTILVLWNHGGGPVYGFGADELYDSDNLTLTEIDKALSSALSGERLAMIGFDACLMGSIEVASVLAPYADYMLASEETEPGDGWAHSGWMSELCGNPSITIPELGQTIIDDCVAYYSGSRNKDSASLALLDLSRAEDVESALNSFGITLCTALDTQLSGVSRARAGVGSFGEYIGEDASDLVDILALCDAMDTYADTSALRAATESMIVTGKTTSDLASYAYGVSVLVPYSTIRDESYEMLSCYDELTKLSGYGEFIRSMVSVMSGSSYTFSASAPSNLATCTSEGIWGELTSQSDWSSDYYLDSAPHDGLWAGLGNSTGAGSSGASSGGLWAGLGSSSSAPSSGLWAGLGEETTASAPVTGLWSGLGSGTSSAAPDLSGLWSGLAQTGNDYYTAEDENPNATDNAPTDLNEAAAGYFAGSKLELQAIYALQLTRDELDHLQSAEAILLSSDGKAELGSLGQTTVDWQTGSIYAMFDGSWPMLAGEMATLKLLSGSNDRAVIPARVGGIDMYLLIAIEENGGEVLGATEGYQATSGLAARGLIPLTAGLEITLLHPTTEGSVTRWIEGGSFVVPDSGLSLTYQPVPVGDYSYAIRLIDIYNVSQLSQEVALTF